MKDLLTLAVSIVDANPIALLTTLGADGAPRARWMATFASQGVHVLWSLSGYRARKIEEIRANPNVTWAFTSKNHDDVVTLTGRATVVPGPLAVGAVWDRLAAITRQYAMSAMGDGEDPRGDDLKLAAIQTIVHRVELLSPRLGIYTPQVIELEAVTV